MDRVEKLWLKDYRARLSRKNNNTAPVITITGVADGGKTTSELEPGKSYDFVINVKPACSAYGVSQVGLSDRIRITVESVLEEVDKDTVYLRVNVK